MYKEKTVFVLGAGSSHELGLPLGTELKRTIANKLNFVSFEFGKPTGAGSDYVILEALKKKNIPVNAKQTGQFLKAIDTYHTIDEFLASDPGNKEFQICGKLAIVKSILDAEAKSRLVPEERFAELDYGFLRDDKSGTFLGSLIRQLKGEITTSNFDQLFHNVSFINFNYDRCLERGLVLGLAKSFPFDSVPEGEFNKWVKLAKIIRPYGSVGSYWPGEENHVPYGGFEAMNINNQAEKLIELVDSIKTFSEDDSQINNADLIEEEIFTAKNIVFLGFHFHSPNLKLLSLGKDYDIPHRSPEYETILATVLGRSEQDRERLKEMFCKFSNRRNPNKVILETGTCYDLFDNNQLAF